MKIICLVCVMLLGAASRSFSADSMNGSAAKIDSAATDAKSKSDADQEKKAAEWVASLQLNDPAKAARLTAAITAHLKAIRDWHNEHSYTNVPAGINPVTGKPLNSLDRQVIMDSTIPKSVHENLMTALRKDLSEAQVETILDKYTVGKVAFTLKGYEAIVPDLTGEEKSNLLNFLKQAREEAIDYKNMKEISAIFEIYKTKCEQYLNSNGRNWHELYKAYFKKIQAQKAAAKSAAKNP